MVCVLLGLSRQYNEKRHYTKPKANSIDGKLNGSKFLSTVTVNWFVRYYSTSPLNWWFIREQVPIIGAVWWLDTTIFINRHLFNIGKVHKSIAQNTEQKKNNNNNSKQWTKNSLWFVYTGIPIWMKHMLRLNWISVVINSLKGSLYLLWVFCWLHSTSFTWQTRSHCTALLLLLCWGFNARSLQNYWTNMFSSLRERNILHNQSVSCKE